MIAAIGGGLGDEQNNFRFVYSVVSKTSKEHVTDFISTLIDRAPVPTNLIVIVLDNHSSHHSKMVTDYAAFRGV